MDEIDSKILSAKVVMLCGVSGSGKTTMAERLTKEGFVKVSSDEMLWDKYGSDFASMPFPEKKRAFMNLGKEITQEVGRNLASGKRVVVDATNCKRFKRDALRDVCRLHDTEPTVVWLDIPFEELKKRLSGRKGSGPNDQIVTEEQLKGFYSGFEAPEPDENPIMFHS